MTDPTTYHHHESVELRVLAAVAAGASTPDEVAARVPDPADTVRTTLDWAVGAGALSRMDLPQGPAYNATPQGLQILAMAQGVDAAVSPSGHVDLGAATRLVMEQYDAARDVATEHAEHDQASWPVDDAARDHVTDALNDAFARGALTREQLDDRTGRALAATTMGDLRAAADGVLDLPPVLPTGIHRISGGGLAVSDVQVNPALKQVTWRHVLYAVCYVVLGLGLALLQPVVGILVVLGGLVLGAVALRPLWRPGNAVTPPR